MYPAKEEDQCEAFAVSSLQNQAMGSGHVRSMCFSLCHGRGSHKKAGRRL